LFEAAFIPFRIEKEAGKARIRLKRVKDSVFDSEEKLFVLADVVDDENGPFADLLDHLTRCRVKLLNDVFKFESKLTVDEVEEELREEQNASFIEGKAVHVFDELCGILDYTPAGFDEDDEEGDRAPAAEDDAEIDDADLPSVDDEDEESIKGDASLKWDEDEEDKDDEDAKPKADGDEDADDEDSEDDEDDKPAKKKPSAKKPAPTKPAPKKGR
jgi:hypothetical protein